MTKFAIIESGFSSFSTASSLAAKENAYGLANTLNQTSNLKPKIKSKKVDNLFFSGQLIVPGPGVPPSIISGEISANELLKQFKL
jgi:phytoene desaturase